MRQKQTFTLVELLVVIGIIAILAGLVIPAVIRAQMQGRITQAKSDMANILLALKGVESTYNKMDAPESGSKTTYSFDNNKVSESTETITISSSSSSSSSSIVYKYIKLGDVKLGDVKKVDAAAQNAYDSFIAELSVPQKIDADDLNVNKRKIKFLDPNPKFDPAADYDDAKNLPYLWRDPWGNRYIILINTNFTDGIPNPADDSKVLSSKAVVYSCGPNGEDNEAKNILYNVGSDLDATCDDIASWH